MNRKHQYADTNFLAGRLRISSLIFVFCLSLCTPWVMAQTSVTKSNSTPRVATKPVGVATETPFNITAQPSWVKPVDLADLPELPASPVQTLLMDAQTRIGAGDTVRFERVVRQITSSAGLEAGSQIELIFDPSYQRLSLHELAIWRNGKKLDRLDRKAVKLLQRESKLERQIVDGRLTASIVLEDTRVGDRVEWAASLSGDNPVFEGRFVDLQWLISSHGPAGLAQSRLLAPPDRKIRHRATAAGVEFSEQIRPDGLRETVFRRRAVPQWRHDPLLPPEDDFTDLLEWSEFQSWAEVAVWAERQFTPALNDREPLHAKVAEIRAATTDPGRRIEMALDFVQKEVRYFGTEIGASSHRPASASQVMRQRFGDCKDKSALLVNLLNQLGIEAVPALVSTTLRQSVGKRLPSPLDFDHAIVAIKQQDGWLWLDATRSLQSGPVRDRTVSGLSPALMARASENALVNTPSSHGQLRVEVRDVFRFHQIAGQGELVSEAIYFGEVAENLRMARASQTTEAFEAIVIGDLAKAYPAYQRQGAVQVEELPGRNAMRITQRLQANPNEIWQLLNKGVMTTDVVLYSVMSPLRLPDMTPRQQALNVNLPGIYRHTVRFEFDEQAYGRETETPFVENNEFFDLRLRNRGAKHFGEFNAELSFRTERIEAAQWTRYRDALQKLWPRMATRLSMPTLATQGFEEFRSAEKTLAERLRGGQIKTSTKVQANAHYELLALDSILAGKRLSPKLTAQMQTERGEHLDHLGQSKAALEAFETAIQLDSTSSEAQAGLAMNALMSGQDVRAQSAAKEALKLSPNSTAPRYTRAIARYMSGDFAGASEDLRILLRDGGNNELERSYRAIWLFLSLQAQGQDGREATNEFIHRNEKSVWPQPVLRLLRGEQSLKDVEVTASADKSEQAGRECELYFFASQKALLERNTAQAQRWLERSLATGVLEFIEYNLARRELDRLSKR